LTHGTHKAAHAETHAILREQARQDAAKIKLLTGKVDELTAESALANSNLTSILKEMDDSGAASDRISEG
jgi:hypothetical protein